MFEKENDDGSLADDNVIVAIKNNNIIEWYQEDREIWVLDWQKWSDDFTKKGFDSSEDDPNARFGILIVNDNTKEEFLEKIQPFKVSNSKLENIKKSIEKSSSWWDVSELFPIAFIDFDLKKLSACYPYPGNTPVERYVPDDWAGEFVDFMRKFDEDILPKKEKYWIIDGIDYLEKLSSLL
ncbi:hypothetical protein [Xenorhabdus doucetiae]|uniref:Group-specific protein n=1 Tax=Xenorhabdus doucetiae TaxID=351671 RepID=A0A068R000_9GAMM|nr:hypothetical protein [Xenorhabdus doucetiae]TYO92302.1 hypothetical protein LY16_03691 [Xenorhabdus doucetiae]CDG19410.1 conserved protein of unknown function [Xenorhabdus doucetiae]